MNTLVVPAGFLGKAPVFLQRSIRMLENEDHAARWLDRFSLWPENAGAASVERALASPSRPLEDATRAFMEPRFGHDFSKVRVHCDESAARTNHALNAFACTVGEHILFGDGQYAPETGTGRRILAHELCHVVQQREGLVEGRPGPGGIKVSDPDDRFERAAAMVTNRVMATPGTSVRSPDGIAGSRASTGTMLTAPAPVQRAHIVQRYLAGVEGHGGIEQEALKEAGFSPVEAKLTYYGNWLRDLSQIGDGRAVHELIRVLATGEFGREPTDAEIGHYLASEHVDRPDKGGTAEDPYLSPQERETKIRALTGEQRRWVEEQQSARFRDLIERRTQISGLPRWIEVGKEHAKRELGQAVALGRTPEGFQALGNGLHAVEDYFAHSNFTEVALAHLVAERGLPANNPLVQATRHYIGIDPSNVQDRPGLPTVDRFGRPRIVTGTSVGWAATMVGLWETLKTEITTGELRKAFFRGLVIRYGWRGIGGAGSWILGKLGGVLGGTLGAIGGALRLIGGGLRRLFTGAAAGAAAGWRGAKHWWQRPFAALGGLFRGAARGIAAGARETEGEAAGATSDWRIGLTTPVKVTVPGRIATSAASGWRIGERIGGAIGQGIFGTAGAAMMGATGFSLSLVGGLLIAAVDRTIGGAIIPFGTRQSIKAAPYGSGPTHSQIAKDDPEHPLFRASRALAHEADLQIGRSIIAAWNGKGPLEERVAAVQALVDLYVAHPYAGDWWKAILLRSARTKGAR